MATMRIYYDINVDQPIVSQVRLSLNGKDVTVTIDNMSPFRFSVSPKGTSATKSSARSPNRWRTFSGGVCCRG